MEANKASRSVAAGWAMAVVVVAALALRLAGIDWSLPSRLHYFSYHPDEILVVRAAQTLSPYTGQLNPHFFNYGSLYMLLISAVLPLAHALLFSTLFTDYLTARLLTALMGAATACMLCLAAWDPRKSASEGGESTRWRWARGVLAAAVLAIMPLHVAHSHYATVDVPATFWVALSLLGAGRLMQEPRLKWYLLSGAAVGLAASTKYNCAIAVLSILAAHLLAGRVTPGDRARAASPRLLLPILAVVVAAAAFVVGTPGVILSTGEFLRDVRYESMHTRTGHGLVFVGAGNGWWYHLATNLRYGLTTPLLLLCLAAVVFTLWRRRPLGLVAMAFALPYYLSIGVFSVRFTRYLVPILPGLALVTADLVYWLATRTALVGWRRAARTAGLALAALAMASGLVASLAYVSLYLRHDPRDRTYEWLLANARGRSVGLTTVPWFYSPPVSPYNAGPQSARAFWQHLAESPFRLQVDDPSAGGAQLLRDPAHRPAYFVISDFEYGDPLRLRGRNGMPSAAAQQVERFGEFWDALNANYRRVAVFSEDPAIGPIRLPKRGLPPHDWLYPYPTLLVYEARQRAS